MKTLTRSFLAFGGAVALTIGLLQAQETTPKVVWKHGLNFQVRTAGEIKFSDKTKKYGAEIFQDRDINHLVYVAENASIGVGSAAKVPEGPDVKPPVLYHALEVKVRAAGEDAFTDKTRKLSTEVFRDTNTDNLVYICETGNLAIIPGAAPAAPTTIKDPAWFHGLEVKARKAGEKEFTDKTRRIGLEVYKDENTNQLFYITEPGSIAVVPAGTAAKPTEVKGPTWFHAFEMQVRKADEKEFTKDTKAYGVEVYKDENAGTLLYVCETGSIAVVPAGGIAKPAMSKDPKWLHGRSFRVRKADEPDFNDKTQRFGAEIYKDEVTGNLVYITDAGAISVFAGK